MPRAAEFDYLELCKPHYDLSATEHEVGWESRDSSPKGALAQLPLGDEGFDGDYAPGR